MRDLSSHMGKVAGANLMKLSRKMRARGPF